MKDTDCAYIAALIDSIGCIKIEPPKSKDESCLYVWITHPDFKVMEYLQRARTYIYPLPNRQFRAKWTDRKAYDLLKSIIRFSHIKRDQMQVGIEFYEAKTSEQKQEKYDIPFRLRLKMLKKSEE